MGKNNVNDTIMFKVQSPLIYMEIEKNWNILYQKY